MKKRFKLWIAYMLILCMSAAVMLPNSKTVRADDTGELEIYDFGVFKNGNIPLDKDVELRDDEPLSVSFRWSLPDSDHTHKAFSTVIENYYHIKFVDKQEIEMRLSNEVVGKIALDVEESTGNVIVTAVFTDDAYLEKSNRNGGATVEAYVDVHTGAEDDGEEKLISIRKYYHFPFTYRAQGDGSSLWVWKSAQGSMYKDESGNYKQDFYVSLRTNGGDVTDVKLFDIPGSGLTEPGNIRIDKSNMTEKIAEGSEMTLEQLQAKLTLMPRDAQIGFIYTVGVDENVYSQSAAQNGDYKNTFRAEYKNSASEPKEAEGSADVSVSRPYIDKNGEILKDADGNPTGKIQWTVRINLNDLADEEVTLADIADSMIAGASDIVLAPMEKRWDGKIPGYTLTYKTDIPAADMNSLSDHKYINDVTVSIGGYDYTGRGEALLPAKSWIDKTFERYDAGNNTLSWKIKVDVPNEAITGVSINDWGEGDNGAWHDVIKDSVRIEVDGSSMQVPEADWSGNQDVWLENGSTIKFKEDYFETLKGKSFTVYVDTLIKNDTVDGKTYRNKAYLNYTLDGTQTKLEASAEWKKDSAILKNGAPDSTATAINYSVDIDLSKFSLNSRTPIIIKDVIPDGLTLDRSSCKVIGKTVYDEWNKYQDDELTNALSVAVSANGRDTVFEIPVTDAAIQRIQAINAAGQQVIFSLTYTAEIDDVRKYLTDGTELTFTNTATGEYGGTDIGDSTNITKITPKQMIEKNWWYNANTAPDMRYEIKVNPDRLDLSDGSLIVTDSMGEKLIYRLNTIQVQKYEGWNLVPLVNGKDYTYVYSQEDNSLVFTLPDSESLLISYAAYVNAYVDDRIVNNEDLTEDNSFNDVSIAGYKNKQSGSKVYFSGKAITPRAWAQNTTNNANLLKIYKSENGTVMLEGCKFRLAEFNLSGGKLVEGRTVTNVVTDANGSAQLSGMVGGQLYGLVETEVPEGGFTVMKEPLYFIFGSREQNPFPSEYGVIYVNDGGTVIFENDPPKTEEESSGESSEDTSPSDEESSSGDTKPSEEGSPSQDTKPSGTEETTNKRGDVEGEGDTTSGVPKDPEKETGGSQTETSTEDEGKTDPDNDRNGDLEGEGNLVNTSDRPYIKVILIFLILGVIAAAVTEATMLWRSDEEN